MIDSVVFIALSALFVIPCLKDLKYKETITFEGVFLHDVEIGTKARYYFDVEGNGKDDNYYRRPWLSGNKYIAERGKRYRVVVYKYSHTIYSLELLE